MEAFAFSVLLQMRGQSKSELKIAVHERIIDQIAGDSGISGGGGDNNNTAVK